MSHNVTLGIMAICRPFTIPALNKYTESACVCFFTTLMSEDRVAKTTRLHAYINGNQKSSGGSLPPFSWFYILSVKHV